MFKALNHLQLVQVFRVDLVQDFPHLMTIIMKVPAHKVQDLTLPAQTLRAQRVAPAPTLAVGISQGQAMMVQLALDQPPLEVNQGLGLVLKMGQIPAPIQALTLALALMTTTIIIMVRKIAKTPTATYLETTTVMAVAVETVRTLPRSPIGIPISIKNLPTHQSLFPESKYFLTIFSPICLYIFNICLYFILYFRFFNICLPCGEK